MDERKEYLTKEKHQELQKELEHLRGVRRKEIAEQLEYAKSLGDLSENAEYHQAREDQAALEDRIMNIEMLLKHAEIVEEHHRDIADIGSTVTVKKKDGGEPRTFQVVGSEEADTTVGKISNRSPLGEALIGTKKGDTIQVKTPSGEVKYDILAVE